MGGGARIIPVLILCRVYGMKRRECELGDVGLELMLAVGVISSMAGCHEEERG